MRISSDKAVTDHGSRFESRTGCLGYDNKLGNLAGDDAVYGITKPV